MKKIELLSLLRERLVDTSFLQLREHLQYKLGSIWILTLVEISKIVKTVIKDSE